MTDQHALRSNFEPGTARWATRIAQWHALGLSLSDMERPKIAVVNTSSSLSICYAHLDEVSQVVQQSIRASGGVPFEVRTVAPSDFITAAGKGGRYILPSRDLIVNDVEVMVEGSQLDAMVCLSSCDKTTPAHIMAAVRLNIPTIILPCGYQTCGTLGGKRVDIDDVYESVGAVASGRMTVDEQRLLATRAVTSPGVCAGLATANTMHILAEVLGLALPDSAPVSAVSKRLQERATECGARIVQMALEGGPLPRDVITASSILNAVTVDTAMGGSVNSVRHIAAIANEAELDLDVVSAFEELFPKVPMLCSLRPNGSDTLEAFEAAGGTRGLQRRLRDHLDLNAAGVSGETLDELVTRTPEPDATIIRSSSNPVRKVGGLQILRGNLAPNGAIVKRASVDPSVIRFAGPARLFKTERDAIDGLRSGSVSSGDVVVLRGLGPMGGPGTVLAAGFSAALHGAGLASSVAVVTDGELSGLNHGLVVGQVMPESAAGGPISVIRDGDLVKIDLENSLIDVEEVDFDRRTTPVDATTTQERGWLAQYKALAQPIERGAGLVVRTPLDFGGAGRLTSDLSAGPANAASRLLDAKESEEVPIDSANVPSEAVSHENLGDV